jgi:hypothetical protein
MLPRWAAIRASAPTASRGTPVSGSTKSAARPSNWLALAAHCFWPLAWPNAKKPRAKAA